MHQHVVDAHGDQVNAHRVVHLPFKGELEFGAHTVGATHQDRLFVTFGHFKQGAKPTNARQNAFAHGFLGQGLDAFDQGVAGVDVNACVFVGKGVVHGALWGW